MTKHDSGAAGPCPDLESLAALLDGRLEEEERGRVAAHLDACEVCYEIFVESARSLAEERAEEAAQEARVIRPPRERWGARRKLVAGLLAAAATVAVVVGILGRGGGSPAEEAAGLRVALPDLAAGPEAVAAREPWSYLRSDQALAGVNPSQRAFRLGVLTAEVEVLLGAGDAAAAEPLVREILALLGEFEFAHPEGAAYRQLLSALAGNEPLPSLQRRARAAAFPVPDVLDGHTGLYLVGLWAESGRLAAAAGDDGFLRRRPFRRVTRRAAQAELPPRLAAPAAEARERLSAGSLPDLERAFARVIEVGADL